MPHPFRALAPPVLTLILVGLVPQPAFAQTVELAPFVGYRFGGGLSDAYYPYDPEIYADFDLAASPVYGVVVDVAIGDQLKIEGFVSQQRTHIDPAGFFGPEGPPMIVDRYFFGVVWEVTRDRIRPFAAVTAGFTTYRPDVELAGSETRFGFGFGGGVKAFFNRNYGVRLEGRASTRFGGSGVGVACGGRGCGFSLGGWGSWDGEAAAGFIFAF
jgi:hypothetical protein